MSKLKSLHATPEAVEQAFYDALEAGNLDALMSVWSDDDEIICIHPGGPRLVGHPAVRASWREILANGPITVRPAQQQVMQGALVSVHSAVARVLALVQTQAQVPGRQAAVQSAQTIAVNILVTHVFFKGGEGWRMVLHHASITQQDVEAAGAPAPNMLH